MFIHTHLHTWFSNYGMIDSINNPDNIIKKVHDMGQLGFAVTDHDGCSGLVEIYTRVKKFNKKNNTNLKLLFGSELYYVYDVSINEAKRYHCLFLAKNEQGRINLNKLVSEAHRHYYKKSRIDLDIIKQYSDGLICTSACMGGWLSSPDAEELIPQFKNIFGDDLYFELHTYQHEEQYVFNHKVIELANKYNVKMIACCDAHYTNPEDYELHKAIRGIQPNEEDKYYQSNDFYLQSEDEVKGRLKYLPKEIVNQAIDNTVEIFNKCNVTISALDNKENNYPKFVDGDPKPLFLKELRKGYRRLGIQNYPPEKKKLWDDRLLHEIDVLEKVNYMDYLLITKDILDHCKEKSIPIGVGRGCQTAGGKILMSDYSIKNIEDIEIGDMVISHTGNTRKVNNVFKYKIKEDLIKIKCGGNDYMTFTKDHKFLVASKSECINYTGDYKQRRWCTQACSKKCDNRKQLEPKWLPVGEIKKGDLVFYPKIHQNNNPIKVLDISKYIDCLHDDNFIWIHCHSHYKLPRYITLDKDFYRLVGYYIGNGWDKIDDNGGGHIGFAFPSKNQSYVDDAINLLHKYFNVDSTIKWNLNKTCCQIIVNRTLLARLFRKLFGHGAVNKHINKIFINDNIECQTELIKGLMYTDGHLSNKEYGKIAYSTTSETLASQVMAIFSFLGYKTLFTRRKHTEHDIWKDELKVTVSAESTLKLQKEIFPMINAKVSRTKPPFYSDDYYYQTVESVEIIKDYDGYVYDFETDIDHSYVSNNIIVHNSANGCECCHLLGITPLDSITNKLYFERFANEHRTSFCDIDNDVSQLRRGEVIDYIKERYGYVYQCRTFSYMKARGALKKACTALCIDFETSNKYAKMLDAFHTDDDEEYTDVDLEYAMLDSIRSSVKNDQLIDLAKSFVGILVGFSKHASAVVILNKDISEFCSLESQVDSATKERVLVAGCDFHILEEMGILKEDILGLRTLDVIDECIKLSNKDIDISKIPWEDDKTCQILQKGDNLGVFQMASSGMVRTLKEIKPTKFQDMIAVVALYRPACILGGTLQEYIDRRNGKAFEYLDPRLEEPLGETYGIMVYQEQIMRVVQVIAGYSLAEADLVRRAIGRKDHELMKQITSEFVERAVNNNTKKDVAEKILDMIVSAGSYSFNKSHSQSYGYLSWITAYLKAHYPKEFYVATINSEHGDQEKIIPYIQEMRSKGYTILPPDLRYSKEQWTIEDGNIRVGLSYIKGIGSLDKPNQYTLDCIYRTYNKRQLEALVSSGSLDFLDNREHLFDIITPYLENIKAEKHIKERIEFFTHQLKTSNKRVEFNKKKLEEWKNKLVALSYDFKIDKSDFNLITYEMKSLGIPFTDPLKNYDISLVNGKNVIAGIVLSYSERKDRNGNLMASIELHNGKRLVMFSRNYLKPLEVYKGYYFAIRGDIINKTKELELIKH